jgi:hypothetical protein
MLFWHKIIFTTSIYQVNLFRLLQPHIFNVTMTILHLGGTVGVISWQNRFHLLKNGVFWDVTPCGSCKTDVSEELGASVTVTRIGELETTSAVTSNRRTHCVRRLPRRHHSS